MGNDSISQGFEKYLRAWQNTLKIIREVSDLIIAEDTVDKAEISSMQSNLKSCISYLEDAKKEKK